jgi:iron complex outermembrane receptor protein
MSNPRVLSPWSLICWLTLLCAPGLAQPATGLVEGRVFNATTGSAVANARVKIEGTTRETTTDAAGEFRFTAVPTGAAEVKVVYLGMVPQTTVVNVPAGGVARREFELVFERGVRANPGDAIKLDAFTVAEDREMSAQAVSLNEQRAAPNIKNVVAIDEFGDRGNENIGEFLLFLPGASISTSGSEPTTIALRGFPGASTGITIDGGEIAASQSGASRALDLREVPFNNVSRVEITKVPTPDMAASGLGGSVNLITRSGFEAKKARLSFNAYSMFHNRTGPSFAAGPRTAHPSTTPRFIEPSFDFNYLKPVNDRLAITLGGSRTWRYKPMETGTKDTDETATWDLVRLVQTTSQWNSLGQIFKTLQGQAGIDWRVSPTDTLSGSAQYRNYDLATTRSVLGFNYGANATGNDRFAQSAVPAGSALPAGSITMNGSGSNQQGTIQTKVYNFRYRHRGPVWRFDASSYYSTSQRDNHDADIGQFNTTPATISNVFIRGENLQAPGQGIIPTVYSASDSAGRAVDVYDGGNYSIVSGNSAPVDILTRRYDIRGDLARDFLGAIPLTVKVGFRVDTMMYDEKRYGRTWTFRPNGASDATSRLAKNFDVFDDAYNATAPTVYGRRVRWISGTKLYQLFERNPSWFVSDEAQVWQDAVNNSKAMTERVSAGYVRLDTRLLNNRLWLVGGVRFERTDDRGAGPLNDINAQYQRNADGSFVDGNPTLAGIQRVLITSDALALRKLRYRERAAVSESNYQGFYPSLNASFNVTESIILRAAWAETIGRPNLGNIIPSTSISDATAANQVITVNNVGLKPWQARSYDLSVESYQIKDGFGSIGVFQKSIKGFFSSVSTPATPQLLELYGLESDPSLLSYTINTLTNGGDATIKGAEFSYRQSLTFLPTWARGFQVFANATKLSLGGSRTADFSGYNPKSLSAGISFARARFTLKGTVSVMGDINTGAVATSATVPAGTFNYQGKRTRIGMNGTYTLSRRYSVYASIVDLGGFVQNNQRYAPTTPEYAKGTRWQELGFYTNVGVRGSF